MPRTVRNPKALGKRLSALAETYGLAVGQLAGAALEAFQSRAAPERRAAVERSCGYEGHQAWEHGAGTWPAKWSVQQCVAVAVAEFLELPPPLQESLLATYLVSRVERTQEGAR